MIDVSRALQQELKLNCHLRRHHRFVEFNVGLNLNGSLGWSVLEYFISNFFLMLAALFSGGFVLESPFPERSVAYCVPLVTLNLVFF